MEFYRRKVDGANVARVRQLQALASGEAEFLELYSALGEPAFSQREACWHFEGSNCCNGTPIVGTSSKERRTSQAVCGSEGGDCQDW